MIWNPFNEKKHKKKLMTSRGGFSQATTKEREWSLKRHQSIVSALYLLRFFFTKMSKPNWEISLIREIVHTDNTKPRWLLFNVKCFKKSFDYVVWKTFVTTAIVSFFNGKLKDRRSLLMRSFKKVGPDWRLIFYTRYYK